MADRVYKSSEYYQPNEESEEAETSETNNQENQANYENPFVDNPFNNINFGAIAANEIAGLKDDFFSVISAVKNFPFRSTLTVVGFLTLVYIGFKAYRKFAKMKARSK